MTSSGAIYKFLDKFVDKIFKFFGKEPMSIHVSFIKTTDLKRWNDESIIDIFWGFGNTHTALSLFCLFKPNGVPILINNIEEHLYSSVNLANLKTKPK